MTSLEKTRTDNEGMYYGTSKTYKERQMTTHNIRTHGTLNSRCRFKFKTFEGCSAPREPNPEIKKVRPFLYVYERVEQSVVDECELFASTTKVESLAKPLVKNQNNYAMDVWPNTSRCENFSSMSHLS
ncbi:uncharacterized protein G2W53_041053 [Senna tora]|uniref:Uncharacterized protein n=1 Tax=Senna tora TaxID=362788 RepID=A0A834SER4_9FABA|nr:uncharacterized protein G2W53_041053 [Senna tora]